MDRLAAMSMFVRVVESGSFSAVAKELNTSQPTVSKNIAELEKKLGVKLLTRSTRSLHLTEAGTDYYERCVGIIHDVEEAENSAGQLQLQPRGKVRINTLAAFGRLHIIPLLREFFELYPDIKVEIMLNDRTVDLIEEGVDLAIRMGVLNDSTLVAKKVATGGLVTVASPEYMQRYGTPQHPLELKDHNWIVVTAVPKSNEVTFTEGSHEIAVHVNGNILTNNSEAVLAAVLDGIGICRIPRWLAGNNIENGKLRVILSEYESPTLDIFAVYPSGRHLPSKARYFMDFMIDKLANNPQI